MLRDYFQQKRQKKINRRLRRGTLPTHYLPLTPNITKLTIVFSKTHPHRPEMNSIKS